jgi:hypothetical protein
MTEDWKNKVSVVACPNHDTNVGWDKLFFISPQIVKCSLCGKEFSREEIRQLIVDEYHYDLQNIQRAYAQNLANLQYISEGFESAQQTFAVDGEDSAASQAVSKPNLLSSLVALFKPTHRH